MAKPTLFLLVFGALALSTPASALEGANRCARLGPDYAAVAGSNGCVRLGGHVRVVMGPSRANSGTAPMGYASQDGFQNAAAQNVRQGFTPFELFRR